MDKNEKIVLRDEELENLTEEEIREKLKKIISYKDLAKQEREAKEETEQMMDMENNTKEDEDAEFERLFANSLMVENDIIYD